MFRISHWNLFWKWVFCIFQLISLKNNYEKNHFKQSCILLAFNFIKNELPIRIFQGFWLQISPINFENSYFSKHFQWLLPVFYITCIKMLYSSLIKFVNASCNILPSSQVWVYWALVCLTFRSYSITLSSTPPSSIYLSFFI